MFVCEFFAIDFKFANGPNIQILQGMDAKEIDTNKEFKKKNLN